MIPILIAFIVVAILCLIFAKWITRLNDELGQLKIDHIRLQQKEGNTKILLENQKIQNELLQEELNRAHKNLELVIDTQTPPYAGKRRITESVNT